MARADFASDEEFEQAKKDRLRQSLYEKWQEKNAAADKELESAQNARSILDTINAVGPGLSDITGSRPKDAILYNSMGNLGAAPKVSSAEAPKWNGDVIAKAGKNLVDDAKAKKDAALSDVEKEGRLKSFDREDEKYQRSEDDLKRLRDAKSEDSIMARAYLSKIAPESAKDPRFENLTAEQVFKIAPGLEEKYKIDSQERNANRRHEAQLKAEKDKGEKSDRDTTLKLSERYNQDPTTKATAEVRSSYERAQSLAAKPGKINDIGLVYSLMRSFDPGSTVREGEFAMAAKAGSWGDQVKAYVELAESGQMPAGKRAEILETIKKQAEAQERRQAEADQYYGDLASEYKVKPDLVVGRKRSTSPAQQNTGGGGIMHGSDLP